MEYQKRFDTLADAKEHAQQQSKLDRKNDYNIIESIAEGVHGRNRVFFVESDQSSFVRNWETHHGFYSKGKYFAV